MLKTSVLALFLAASSLSAQRFPGNNYPPNNANNMPLAWLEQKLLDKIADYDKRMEGVLGVAIIDLSDGTRLNYHADTVFPTASTIKIFILSEAFRQRQYGTLHFEESVTLDPADVVPGSGALAARLKKGPITVTVQELIREMIVSSDNTATNWLIKRMGMGAINAHIQQLGWSKTRLGRVMLDQAAASRNEENVSTPSELVDMLRRLYTNSILSSAASQEMLAIMKDVRADIRKAVPPAIPVAAKPGEVTGVRCEAGIVYLAKHPFAIAVMGTFLDEPKSPVEDITRLVLEHFQKLEKANIYGNLGTR